MDLQQANQIIARRKRCSFPPRFDQKATHANFNVVVALAEDEDGITIPGLTVQIEYRVPKWARVSKYTFTLFQLKSGRRRRVYQLEVQPATKRTSVQSGHNIHGPHEHINDHEIVQAVRTQLATDDYAGWLAEFANRAHLTIANEPPPPFGACHEL